MTPRPHGIPGTLDRATRERALHRLTDRRYDVLVVGGGVTGAGVALDAASRGLHTALVERVDLAAGTSRWSSKLVHGGLRYLAKGDLRIAAESAHERHALATTIAPHLVRPLATIVPLDDNTGPWMGALTEAGIRLADLLRVGSRTPRTVLPPPLRVSAEAALLHAPGLRREGLRGGIVYWDAALEDDARLVIALARTAAAYGADILTHCAAADLTDSSATLTDEFTGATVAARARVVVNATGVWAGELEPGVHIRPSRGSHLVVRSSALGDPRAMMTAPVPGHVGRFVFAVPHPDGVAYIGLTDEPADGVDGLAPAVPAADEEFLLATMSLALQRPLTAADIIGRFAGLRPLVAPAATTPAATTPGAAYRRRVAGRSQTHLTRGFGSAETADASRIHVLLDEPGRPVSIIGGKLTTYRRMAQDTVDAVCRRLAIARPCRTATLPLLGAATPQVLRAVAAPPRLVRRYGTQAPAVAGLAEEFGAWLAEPVAPSCPTIGVELLHGVLAEAAMTVDDLLTRRTRVCLIEADIDAAIPVAEQVLDLAATIQTTRGEARRHTVEA